MELPLEQPSDLIKKYYNNLWRSVPAPHKKLYTEMRCRKRTIFPFVRKISSDSSTPLRIMDLGCGCGWLTKALSEFGDSIGIDISITEAKKRYPDMKFLEADILWDEIEGNYDVIVSSEVLEHIARENQQTFVRRTRELLNEKGLLVLTTPNKPVAESLPQDLQPIENWLDKDSLMKLVDPFFEIKYCGSTYFLPLLLLKHTALKALARVYRMFYSGLGCYKIIDGLLGSTNSGIHLVIVGQKKMNSSNHCNVIGTKELEVSVSARTNEGRC